MPVVCSQETHNTRTPTTNLIYESTLGLPTKHVYWVASFDDRLPMRRPRLQHHTHDWHGSSVHSISFLFTLFVCLFTAHVLRGDGGLHPFTHLVADFWCGFVDVLLFWYAHIVRTRLSYIHTPARRHSRLSTSLLMHVCRVCVSKNKGGFQINPG